MAGRSHQSEYADIAWDACAGHGLPNNDELQIPGKRILRCPGEDWPPLNVRVVGSGAMESVDVYTGLDTIKTFRPYGDNDLGTRVKIVCSGAQVQGRDRFGRWDGGHSCCGKSQGGLAAFIVALEFHSFRMLHDFKSLIHEQTYL